METRYVFIDDVPTDERIEGTVYMAHDMFNLPHEYCVRCIVSYANPATSLIPVLVHRAMPHQVLDTAQSSYTHYLDTMELLDDHEVFPLLSTDTVDEVCYEIRVRRGGLVK